MKNCLTLFLFALLSSTAHSQSVTYRTLSINNVDAALNDSGIFFNNPQIPAPGYSIPNNSLLTTIFSMAFWYAGVDANGQLKLSAQKYTPFADQFEGPLTNDGTATADVTGTWDVAIFEVFKQQVVQHQLNYTNVGYVPSQGIANWPGNGDVANNFDSALAPYVDVDNDGIYDPLAGDYPCIRGDHAIYVVMNDKADTHASGGDPIGIEMHYMFYEYISQNDLNNTTFVHGKVINRSTQTLQDFKMSTFIDGDIGNYSDDYFGSDSTRSLMYFYNGDNWDEAITGVPYSYMENPPAIGLLSLTHDFESIGILDPAVTTAAEFWNAMNAKDMSGTPWMNPTSMSPTKFQFASDPSNSTEPDSEVALANPPGDRRGVATINLGGLTPNQEHFFDYAIIYNRDTIDNIDNASGLFDVADFIQDFYDSSIVNECSASTMSINELSDVEFSIFPNPSDGQFTVSLNANVSNLELVIRDITGRVVFETNELNSKEIQVSINQPSGIYLMHVRVDGRESVKRIILN